MTFWQRILSWFGLYHEPSPVVVPTARPEFSGSVPGPWSITQGSSPGLVGNSFNFPTDTAASGQHISYVEAPLNVALRNGQTLTLNYTISGDNPVFNNDSVGNVQVGLPTIRLLLHQAGDNMSGVGPYAYYRWYSVDEHALMLGDNTLTVPLVSNNWTPVYPPGVEAGFQSALANCGLVGFVFGGGNFAGHGVCITSGSATFTINSYTIT